MQLLGTQSKILGQKWLHLVALIIYYLVIKKTHTFHDVDYAADIPLFDDEAASGILDRVHAVNDLADLGHLEVLHEVIV